MELLGWFEPELPVLRAGLDATDNGQVTQGSRREPGTVLNLWTKVFAPETFGRRLRRHSTDIRQCVSKREPHVIRRYVAWLFYQGADGCRPGLQPLARTPRRPRHPSVYRHGLRVFRLLVAALQGNRHHDVRGLPENHGFHGGN